MTIDRRQGNELKLCQGNFRLVQRGSALEGYQCTETGFPGSGCGTKPVRVQEASGTCSYQFGLVLGCPVSSGEVDLMIHGSPPT